MVLRKESYKECEFALGKMLKIGIQNSSSEVDKIIDFCREFSNIIAWTYEDLKVYEKSVVQHTIELVSEVRPVRQKQRPVNPKIEALMQQEVLKLW